MTLTISFPLSLHYQWQVHTLIPLSLSREGGLAVVEGLIQLHPLSRWN